MTLAALVASCSSDDDAAPSAASVDVTTTDLPDTGAAPTTVAAPETTATPTTATPTTSAPTTTAVPPDPYLIGTVTGPVRGGPSAIEGIRNFLAIPYGEPPVGDLAWRPPVPRASWTDAFDATGGGASCPQTTEGVTTSFLVTPDADPDCLTLSVWSPDDAAGLPVMVWIHGGGLSTGSAHEPYYTGDDLAAEGVVVVNVNYRLGALGFLALPELQAESADGAVGNYGFMDQQLALQWVHDNIEAFGGDPDLVTIFGESAGGFSVCGHLAAPASQGLFTRAIVQSGGGCDRLAPLDSAFAAGQDLLDEVGCADVVCLRGLDPETIIAAEASFSSLVRDGVVLPATAAELAPTGAYDGIDVLIGSNADEATLFTLGLQIESDDDLVARAGGLVDDGAALMALYADVDDRVAAYQAMFTDVSFACPALAFARQVPNAYSYQYTFVSESNPLGLGATHGAELAFLFNHPEGLLVETQRTDRTAALSDAIQAAWASFAATGDPGPPFTPFEETGPVTLLDDPVATVDGIRDGRCDDVNALRAGNDAG